MNKPPFWATCLTVIAITILIGLGGWQLQRLEWKTELLQALKVEQTIDPLTRELTGDTLSSSQQLLLTGFIEGIFLHDKEILIEPRTHNGKPGYHLVTPFETIDNLTLLVNRGWLPLNTDIGMLERPDEPLILTGTARKHQGPGFFAPANSPHENKWYSLSLEEIADAKELTKLSNYIFYERAQGRKALPIAIEPLAKPANNHLSYALFWFSMAGVLLVIYYLRFIRKTKTNQS